MEEELTPQADGEDVLAVLARVVPGYVAIGEAEGWRPLHVMDFDLAPGFTVSVGFELDSANCQGDFGPPVFLHRRMSIRQFGSAEEVLASSGIREMLAKAGDRYPAEAGLLPLLRTFCRIERGDGDVLTVLTEELQHFQALLERRTA